MALHYCTISVTVSRTVLLKSEYTMLETHEKKGVWHKFFFVQGQKNAISKVRLFCALCVGIHGLLRLSLPSPELLK